MPAPAWGPDLERFCAETMAEHKIPGLSLGVAQDGEPVYARGFGQRDREAELPARPETVYGIASCTKSFTAVAIMQLQEAGRLSVHDPVLRHLPEFRTPDPEATRRITLHHLLTHTGGLPPLPSRALALARASARDPDAQPADRGGEGPIDTFEQLMDYIARCPFELLGPPGALFSYCNDGYALLGAVVERASGQPYADYVRDRILAPAGMARTTFSVAAVESDPEATVIYASRGTGEAREVFRSPAWEAGPVWDPPGGLKSTVLDLLRYLEIYRTGGRVGGARILSPESVAAMTAQHVVMAAAGHPPFPPGAGYGYGLSVRRRPDGVTLVGHGGGRKGVSAHILVAPAQGVTGAVLSNLAGVPAAQILEAAMDGQLGLPVPGEPFRAPAHACPPERLRAYAGEYRSGEGARIVVSVEEGSLLVETQGERLPARPVAEDAFVVREGREQAFLRFLPRAVTFGSRIVPKLK
jgi:CubicO group peptidase (beta-lactamase class C family)